jgi:hypothetical protein
MANKGRRGGRGRRGRGKKPKPKKPEPREENLTRHGMVCLPGTKLDLEQVVDAYRERYPLADGLILEGEAGAALGTLGPDRVMLTHVGAPIPWADLEGPCETAWHYWERATQVVKQHQSHVVCAVLGQEADGAIERTLRLTRLVAAVVAGSKATAVYWTEAPIVLPREAFLEATHTLSREEVPLEMWVDFRPMIDEERTSVFTAGMDALGLLEIEIRDAASPMNEVLDLVYEIAHYLVAHGMVIGDGDTVEFSASKLRVSYVDSAWKRPGPVLLLEAL